MLSSQNPYNQVVRQLEKPEMQNNIALPLYPDVATRIAAHHDGGITEEDCIACSSPCCSQGGFAILENVILIYEKYKASTLRRADFEFKPDLSFQDFVFEYFDVYVEQIGRLWWKRDLMCFHMRSLSDEGTPISIPSTGYYWEIRATFFERNPSLNKGCVFLSKKAPNWPEDDGDSSRYCILHTPEAGKRITEKPIDCIFFTCDIPKNPRLPSLKTSEEWFRALDRAYPGSIERFKALITSDETDSAVQTS